SEDDGNGEEDQGLRISEEERLNEEEETDELYRDQESSSVSSQFVTSMLNPTSDAVLQNLPTFDSVFRFDDRLKSLEANFSKYIQTNPFAEDVSNILGIVHQYMNQQMNEAVRVAVQIQTDRLRDSYQRENDEFLQTIDDNMKRIIKEQTVTLKRRRDDESDKDEGPSAGSDRGSKRRREGKESELASAPLQIATRSAGRSTTGSKSRQASASESAFAEEPVQTTSQIKEPSHPVFEIELEYHLEEVYKATTDQLDWVNPEGQ
nr:hypothetical protein [Tanacetum cinerariifolium]